MKIHRFINSFIIQDNIVKITEVDIVGQIKNVLKLKVGEQIILGDGQGNEILAELKNIGKKEIEAVVLEKRKNQNEPKKKVVLYCALLKRENFELVAQKATEIGVSEIIPLLTERTIKLGFKKERLEKIIKEAVEQSGRGIVPTISSPIEFEKVFSFAKQNEVNLLFDLSGDKLDSEFLNYKTIGVFIGPEGGWGEKEITLAQKNGFKIVSLGNLTLRGETAAIIASYLVLM